MSILQLLNQILSILGEVLTILGVINGNTQNVATESAPLEIQSAAVGAVNLLEDPTIGLQGLYNEIVAARADLGADLATILAAIGNTQQAGDPVTLPSNPPTAWTTTISQATADGVWTSIIQDGNQAGADLALAYNALNSISEGLGVKFPNQPFLKFFPNWIGVVDAGVPQPLAPLDMFTIIATDATAADWVLRAYPAYNWFTFDPGAPFYQDQGMTGANWVLDVTDDQFALMKAVVLGEFPGVATGAPVWPGLTGVTLGTPVALTPNLELTQAMHGVVVNISSVAPSTAYFTYGSEVAYRHIGGLAFFDDANATEDFQFLGFPLAVYLPKSLAEAGGVRFNVPATLTGTVTPFTIP